MRVMVRVMVRVRAAASSLSCDEVMLRAARSCSRGGCKRLIGAYPDPYITVTLLGIELGVGLRLELGSGNYSPLTRTRLLCQQWMAKAEVRVGSGTAALVISTMMVSIACNPKSGLWVQ